MKDKGEHFLFISSQQISRVWYYLFFSFKDLCKTVSFFEASSNLPNFQDCLSWKNWNRPDFSLSGWKHFLVYTWTCILFLWLPPFDHRRQLSALFTWFLFFKCAQSILVFEVTRTSCEHLRKWSRVYVLTAFYEWKLLLEEASYLDIN